MSQEGGPPHQEELSCFICLDILKDPVTLACGHSYCSSCIDGRFDQDEQKGVYSCPQCRRSFTPRPSLVKNSSLAEEVEKLKETEGEARSSPSERMSLAEPEPEPLVPCDLCIGTRNQSASKSCLMCLVSYCETHLQPHYQYPVLKRHRLVKASCRLEERICASHDKLLEAFCRTDQLCICLMCVLDEHKRHDVVSARAERMEKQSKLGLIQQKVQQRVQEREKEMEELQQAVESLKRSGRAAEEDIERIFTELIRSIEKSRTEVKELIRAQQGAAVSEAEGMVEGLEQEIAELKRRDDELEQLSHTDDHIHFLQTYKSLSILSEPPEPLRISASSLQYFSHVTRAVSEVREKMADVIKREKWSKISFTGVLDTSTEVPPPEQKPRADFLQYSCELMLDSNTANPQLSLSEDFRMVKHHQPQIYPDHPDRFTCYTQVLCVEGLSERSYWEVEWKGNTVDIAVSYKDISRTDSSSWFGGNDKSWMLRCSDDGYSFHHKKVETQVSGPLSSKVGVYLDYKGGTLSFYSVSDTATLLHRVQTTFTQSLCPGFLLWNWNNSAEISKLW